MDQPMSSIRSAGSAFVAMASRASSQFFLIAVTLVATRYMSPTDFGIFAIATAFVTFARTLLYTGPFEYLLKTDDLEGHSTECLVVNGLVATASGVVLGALALASSWLFTSPQVSWLLLILIPSNFIAAFASWEEALLLRTGQIKRYYVITALVEFASSSLAIVLLFFGFKLGALIAQIYARLIILTVVYWWLARPVRLNRPRRRQVLTIARWSTARYGGTVVSFLSNYSGDLILGLLLSPAATGLFRASNRVVTAASDMFAQPTRILAMTALSRRAASGGPPGDQWFSMFVGIAFIGWPALIGIAVLAQQIAPIALGNKWAGAGTAISILAIARIWGMLSAVTGALLVANNRQNYAFFNQLFSAIGVAVATVLFSYWGVTGAAFASLLVATVSTLSLTWKTYQLAPVSGHEARRLLPVLIYPIVASLGGALVGQMISGDVGRYWALSIPIMLGATGWAIAVGLVWRRALGALASLTDHPVPKEEARA